MARQRVTEGGLPPGIKAAFSASEGLVLRELWQQGETTVRELTDALKEAKGWNTATVSSFVERLEEKGWVELVDRLRYRERRFGVKVERDHAIRWLADQFLEIWVTDEASAAVVRDALARREKVLPKDE